MTASTVPVASSAAPAALKWWPVKEPGVRVRSAATSNGRAAGRGPGAGCEEVVRVVTGALTGRW